MTRAEPSRTSTRVVSVWIGDASDERGYARLCGEVARTNAPHAWSLHHGQAQTMHSQEMNRRAVDLTRGLDGHDQLSGEA
jgi:hypothetical protein